MSGGLNSGAWLPVVGLMMIAYSVLASPVVLSMMLAYAKPSPGVVMIALPFVTSSAVTPDLLTLIRK